MQEQARRNVSLSTDGLSSYQLDKPVSLLNGQRELLSLRRYREVRHSYSGDREMCAIVIEGIQGVAPQFQKGEREMCALVIEGLNWDALQLQNGQIKGCVLYSQIKYREMHPNIKGGFMYRAMQVYCIHFYFFLFCMIPRASFRYYLVCEPIHKF